MMKAFCSFAILALFAAAPLAAQTEVTYYGGDGPRAVLANKVVVGNTVYLSGALGTNGGDTIEGQTRAAMESLRESLAEVGGTMDDVVKCLVFMADLSERPKLNEVYASFFPNHKPARSAVGVDLNGALVEIECIAILPDA